MAELVGQGAGVVQPAVVGLQDVRRAPSHPGRAEGAGPLAPAHLGVDAAAFEHVADELAELGVEAAVGGQHQVPRLLPCELSVGNARQWRPEVPAAQALEAEKARLETEVPLAHCDVALHDVHQGVHRSLADIVRQQGRFQRRGVAAQLAHGRVVADDGSQDVCPQQLVPLEGGADRLVHRPSGGPLRIVHVSVHLPDAERPLLASDVRFEGTGAEPLALQL